jgi:hypothetical protein
MRIRESLPDSKRIEIFLHEVLHFLLGKVRFASEDAEEQVVDTLGQELVGFIRDNSDCFAGIAAFLKEESNAGSIGTR